MILDGLWVGEWRSNVSKLRISSGVLVFHQGKIFGGNDRVYIIGDLTVDPAANTFAGSLRIAYYAGEPIGIFGLIDMDHTEHMAINGHYSEDELTLEGIIEGNRKLRLKVLLHKKAGCEIF